MILYCFWSYLWADRLISTVEQALNCQNVPNCLKNWRHSESFQCSWNFFRLGWWNCGGAQLPWRQSDCSVDFADCTVEIWLTEDFGLWRKPLPMTWTSNPWIFGRDFQPIQTFSTGFQKSSSEENIFFGCTEDEDQVTYGLEPKKHKKMWQLICVYI